MKQNNNPNHQSNIPGPLLAQSVGDDVVFADATLAITGKGPLSAALERVFVPGSTELNCDFNQGKAESPFPSLGGLTRERSEAVIARTKVLVGVKEMQLKFNSDIAERAGVLFQTLEIEVAPHLKQSLRDSFLIETTAAFASNRIRASEAKEREGAEINTARSIHPALLKLFPQEFVTNFARLLFNQDDYSGTFKTKEKIEAKLGALRAFSVRELNRLVYRASTDSVKGGGEKLKGAKLLEAIEEPFFRSVKSRL